MMSLFSKPRRNDRVSKAALYVNIFAFVILSEVFAYASAVRSYDFQDALVVFARTGGEFYFIHYGFRIRSIVASLPDEDLEDVLINTICRHGLKVAPAILFVITKPLNCIAENSFIVDKCGNDSIYSAMVNTTIFILYATYCVNVLASKLGLRMAISWNRLASFDLHIGTKIIQSLLLLIALMFTGFLFTAMGKREGYDVKRGSIAHLAGYISMVSSLTTFVWRSHKVLTSFHNPPSVISQISSGGPSLGRDADLMKISQVWHWGSICGLVLQFIFQIRHISNTAARWDTRTLQLQPFVWLTFASNLHFNPRCNKSSYMNLLYSHAFFQVIVGCSLNAAGSALEGNTAWLIVYGIAIIPSALFLWALLKMRASSLAALPDAILSNVLIKVIFQKCETVRSP